MSSADALRGLDAHLAGEPHGALCPDYAMTVFHRLLAQVDADEREHVGVTAFDRLSALEVRILCRQLALVVDGVRWPEEADRFAADLAEALDDVDHRLVCPPALARRVASILEHAAASGDGSGEPTFADAIGTCGQAHLAAAGAAARLGTARRVAAANAERWGQPAEDRTW